MLKTPKLFWRYQLIEFRAEAYFRSATIHSYCSLRSAFGSVLFGSSSQFFVLNSSLEKLQRPITEIVKLDANENPYGPPTGT